MTKPHRNGTTLPTPHNLEAEQALVSCVLQNPALLSDLAKHSAELFYDLRHASLWTSLRDMHRERKVIDAVTLHEHLRACKALKHVGGWQYVADLWDKAPSPANWPYYLDLVREPFAKRRLAGIMHDGLSRLAENGTDPKDFTLGLQADLETAARIAGGRKDKPQLKVWRCSDLLKYQPPEDASLVGDNEIVKGYEGVVVLAGPGSSGKSLCTATLALAGARGCGYWMGRKVHRRFKTLIIQAENGVTRLKKEVAAMADAHPELNIDDHIFFSEPPEGGLPFHRGDFRSAVRDDIARLGPDLVIIDPWSQVATEDAAKEVVDKLAEIRSCFPAGEDCPGLLIVAHTKKPRPEDVRRGRGLVYMVSGSIALPNTARCVYVLLPWCDDPEDNRVYWCCPKLNNGEMYPASVWRRKFGTFFEHDDKTNPRDFGKDGDDRQEYKLTEEHLRSAFEKTPDQRSGDLVKKLKRITGCSEATAWRAIGEDGHLRQYLRREATGKLVLKEMAR